MQLLSTMSDSQTLALYSGHPMGLFPSHPDAPRVVVTNGMVIPNYSSRENYQQMYAQGVSQYGQMTAGAFCYIGPQGIVHGTALTLMNAGRQFLGVDSLVGKVFVTAGLGGMSGAQAKAAVVTGAVAVIAEVKRDAILKRYEQGWVSEVADDLDDCIERMQAAKAEGRATSIAYHGNIVDLWERLSDAKIPVDLGSDQTSCHDPFGGGYYPAQLTAEEADKMIAADPSQFKALVQESLKRHCAAINTLSDRGMKFWDYGNSFLLECGRAGADVFDPDSAADSSDDGVSFRYPSYVESIMGDIFSLGFGPFRWVVASNDPADLATTDRIAASVMARLRDRCRSQADYPGADAEYAALALPHFEDNHTCIVEAEKHQMTVGSQARILYANGEARVELARAFNNAVRNGELSAPVVLSRDHHDVSGTDSPWRETANITDGSRFTADMAIHNVIGDAVRGATWVQIHNGGGTGWGEAVNGGFGLVLDGTDAAARRASSMLQWDVYNGVSRRAWGLNSNAQACISAVADGKGAGGLEVTEATGVSPEILKGIGL